MRVIVSGRAGRVSARALLAALVCTAGCGGPRLVYDRPGVDLATLDAELARCRKDARSGWRRAVDETLVRRCMERLGYTAAPPP
jgi:hypothetical protein